MAGAAAKGGAGARATAAGFAGVFETAGIGIAVCGGGAVNFRGIPFGGGAGARRGGGAPLPYVVRASGLGSAFGASTRFGGSGALGTSAVWFSGHGLVPGGLRMQQSAQRELIIFLLILFAVTVRSRIHCPKGA